MSAKVMAVACANGDAHVGRDDKPWTGTDFQELLVWARNLDNAGPHQTDCGPHSVAALGSFNRQRCACTLAEPCSRNCSCAEPLLSGGCRRCVTYGSAEQRQGMAEFLARRFRALDEFAASSPIEWQDEDETSYDKREVWCQWCGERMLAEAYIALANQGSDYPHEDDCTWVLAGGREA